MNKTRFTVIISLLSALAACPSASTAQTSSIKVLEYQPAPGQSVNTLPEFSDGDTYDGLLKKCGEQLNDGLPVCLGACGGYMTVSLGAPIENKRGSDLRILGNAFYSTSDPLYGAATIGGSIEPGTVWAGVGTSPETAEWYELAGSEYYTTERHNFKITYHRPAAEEGAHSLPYSTCDRYISFSASWTEPDGTRRDSTGWLMKNSFHTQSYWPQWAAADELTFSGALLPNNAVNYGGTGAEGDEPQSWILYRYAKDAYGYADAAPNSDTVYTTFDLDWAVDADGNHVPLTHADFIRIQTGVLQQCGWIGETSTEVCAIENLHLQPGYDADPIVITPRPSGISGIADNAARREKARFAPDGTRITSARRGLNIITYTDGTVRKVVVR